jgi:hypothetical protein
LHFKTILGGIYMTTQTAKERWNSMASGTKEWLEERISHISKYAVPENDMDASAPCFFCGKSVSHINEGGEAWAALVKTEEASYHVLYCNTSKHDGPDASDETEEAHNKALWYENGEYDIIGFQGYDHTVLTNPTEGTGLDFSLPPSATLEGNPVLKSDDDAKPLDESEIEDQLSRCICGHKPSSDEWTDCNGHGMIIACKECSENEERVEKINHFELGKSLYHDWRIQVEDNNSYEEIRAMDKDKLSLADLQSGFVEERCKNLQKQPDEEDLEAFYGALDEIGIEHCNKK